MSDLNSIGLANVGLILHGCQNETNAVDAVRTKLLLLFGLHGHG
jgi:hypothetical protein